MIRKSVSFLAITIVGIMSAFPSGGVQMTSQIRDLLEQKDKKVQQLETCEGKKKGWMIAGISTIGLTAVGVGVNIAQANKSDNLSGQIDSARHDLEVQERRLGEVNSQISEKMSAAPNTLGTAVATGNIDESNGSSPLNATVTFRSSVVDISIDGSGSCYKSHDNTYNSQDSCPAATYNALNNGEWATVYSYDTVKGISMCTNISSNVYASIPSDQTGIQTAYDNWVREERPSATSSFTGGYCYCKVIEPNISSAARWVFQYSNSVSNCANFCAYACANYAELSAGFRGALFGGSAN